MNRCETCKHWKREPLVMDEFSNYSYDGRGPYKHNENWDLIPLYPLGDWGECVAGHGKNGQPVMTETLVFARDTSAYNAVLSTHKTFGCVMHEQRAP